MESAMRATIDMTGDASKDYVLTRLSNLYYEKECKVYRDFEPPHPKDAKEAKKWAAEGNFHIRTYGDDEDAGEAGAPAEGDGEAASEAEA